MSLLPLYDDEITDLAAAGITGDRLGKFLEIPASEADHANGALITLHSISCNE